MSTAADILGLNRRSKVPAHWATHYQRLCAERDRLTSRDLDASESARVKLDDLTDAANDETQRSLTLVASYATQGRLSEVLEALQRIERGTYGICEVTGQPIDTARLEALPWARYSLEGQCELERAGSWPRLALPNLQPAFEETSSQEKDQD